MSTGLNLSFKKIYFEVQWINFLILTLFFKVTLHETIRTALQCWNNRAIYTRKNKTRLK